MGWITGAAVYVIVWWVVLFAVLPWGVEPVSDDDVAKGHAASAPKRPRVLQKLLLTTVIAAVCWAVIYAIAVSDLITFRE